jgi:hypothetical protein
MVGRYWQKQGQTKYQQSAFQPEKETKTPLCEQPRRGAKKPQTLNLEGFAALQGASAGF